ncbi:MAG TPA: ferrous iron transport protein B [Candidatus Korarchaeota archaeon]|nr:ferrous iron transport protein B [Candidatus Korarchaeota archaeon]
MGEVLVAIAGSPNVGKSTLFNRITGGNVHVANWPGVTLQRAEGHIEHHGIKLRVVDLPGTYSLSAQDLGEKVARDFIVGEKPDVLVIVVDSTSLEKSLYLAIMTLELYTRVVIALNMIDAAEKRGIHIDVRGLEAKLGVPVIPVSALKGIGIGVLLDRILDIARSKIRKEPLRVDYDGLETYIHRIEKILRDEGTLKRYPARWAAIRLLEGDEVLLNELREEDPELAERVKYLREKARIDLGEDLERLAISSRYSLIDAVVRSTVTRVKLAAPSLSERLDKVMLHPVLGPLASTLIILVTFFLIFAVNTGFPLNLLFDHLGYEELAGLVEEYSLSGILGTFFDWVSSSMVDWLTSMGYSGWAVGLLSDGIMGSVGTLASFTPLLLMAYVFLGAMQDSGLFPRAAVAFDNLFKKFGLSGRAFFPAALGMGCSVAAVVSTRAMDDDRERMVTAMTSPLIPCQARLLVLLALASAAFSNPLEQSALTISVYLLSFMLYLVTSKLLNKFIFRVDYAPDLMMELPPYHRPSLRVVWWYARSNTEHFLRKAGLLIVGLGVATWFLLNFGPSGYLSDGNIADSFAASIGELLVPLTSLIGLPDWKYALAFEVGFVAKEGLLITFSAITGISDPVEALRAMDLTPLRAVSMALAMNYYVPCLATVAALTTELRVGKYVFLTVLLEMVLALLLAGVAYWAGYLLGLA